MVSSFHVKGKADIKEVYTHYANANVNVNVI